MLKIFLIILFNLTVIIQQFSAKASDPVTNAAISEGVPFIFKTLKSVKDKVVDVIDNKKEKKEIENLSKNQKSIGNFICISEEANKINFFLAKNLDECNFEKHSNFKYLVFQNRNPNEYQYLNHYNSRYGTKSLSYKVLKEMIGNNFEEKFIAKNTDIQFIKKASKDIIEIDKDDIRKTKYVFCFSSGGYYIQTKCTNGYEISIKKFVTQRLTKPSYSETETRSDQVRFNQEVKKLLFEFDLYNLESKLIYNIIDKDENLKNLFANSKINTNKVYTNFNWYALVKHPKLNNEFIATKVSNEQDAKRIALNKCYDFVRKILDNDNNSNLVVFECYVDQAINENKNQLLAKELLAKQNNQKIAKKVSNIKDKDYVAKICAATNYHSWNPDKPVKYKNIYIFNFGGSCPNGFVSLKYGKFNEIEKNIQNYAADWQYDYLKKAYTNSICFNVDNEKINNLSKNCNADEIQLYISGGDDYKLYLTKNNNTQLAKIENSNLNNNNEDNESSFKGTGSTWMLKPKYEDNSRFNDELCKNAEAKAIEHALFERPKEQRIFDKKKIIKRKISNYSYNQNYRKCIVTVELIKNKNKISTNTEIVKKQKPTVIKKEEFQPKDNNQDNKAPVIKIAKSFKVNEPSYVIEGEVTDQSDRIFIEVEGKTIQAKDGKFKINRFSPIDEEFNIVAIDQWGNRSEPQLVQITVDTSVSLVADKVEPLNPTKIRSKPDRNKIALIIGIEKYEQTPNASFANLDAKYFYEYARNSFGVSKKNIKILVDEDANLIQSLGTLNKWLPGKVKSNQTEVIIFFAGHGLASNNGEELFLLPQDSDPDLLERTALSRNELFESLLKLNPKSVTMFFDTCFSGISRDEKTLLASARPIRITANEQDDVPNNFTIFSASQLDQISSGLKEAKHGIFSYF
jgi:hypothetical protein